MEETGYVLEASYVILIESCIFTLAFLGFVALVAQQLYMPTLPTSTIVLFAAAISLIIVAIIFIHAGFHGSDEKQVIGVKFRANAFTLGILQAIIHVLTAAVGVFLGFGTFYLVSDSEHLMLAALFSSRMLVFQLNVSMQTYIVACAAFLITIYLLFVILFVTLRNCLGDLKNCRIHVFGFCESVVVLSFWFQYFRQNIIDQLCAENTLCNPEDISLYSSQDLFLMQMVLIYCAGMLFLEMLTAKIYTLFVTGKQILFFLLYLFLRLLSVAGVVVGYFVLIEDESNGLKYVNWALAAALLLFLLIEAVFVLLRDKSTEKEDNSKSDKQGMSFNTRRKPFLEWSDAITLGPRRRRNIAPFVPKFLKKE